MADCYVTSCFTIQMTEEQAEYTIKELKAYSENEDLAEEENPASWLDIDELSYKDGKVYFLFPEMGSTEAFDKFIQQLIQKFNLPPVGYTWATTCSKYRPNEFSGGAGFITAQEIKYFNTSHWLIKQHEIRETKGN